ncbi:transcriptional regulator [Burkholderia cenocepacia]|uniref:Helix-turn-helix domain-containing protein n=1 Tax=Burkholderia cenocepacia TaxID=95486 RepID=A0A6B2MCE0_9BURK|nr:YdaS family helix-turn-helix protein [Burkholderia cenocepacia]NDV73003.1 helix-turn-helix domain-containing protein [Burkholderia cenocepacia]
MDLKTYLSAERGRLVALSRAIGAHASDVSRWASGERPVPIPFGLPIERATDGQVTRPEMFSAQVIERVWPELTELAKRKPKGAK